MEINDIHSNKHKREKTQMIRKDRQAFLYCITDQKKVSRKKRGVGNFPTVVC